MKLLLTLIPIILVLSCTNDVKNIKVDVNPKEKQKVKEEKQVNYKELVDGEILAIWKDNKRKGKNTLVLHKLPNDKLKLKVINISLVSIEYDVTKSIEKGIIKYTQEHLGGIYYLVKKDGSLEEYNAKKLLYHYDVFENHQ